VISATAPAASPAEAERTLVLPLERALRVVPGVDAVQSAATHGGATLAVRLTGASSAEAEALLREAVASVAAGLPGGAAAVTVGPPAPRDRLLRLVVPLPDGAAGATALQPLRARVVALPGVQGLLPAGPGTTLEVRVDPQGAAALGLLPAQLGDALAAALEAGVARVEALGQLEVAASSAGTTAHLKDVARLAWAEPSLPFALLDGDPAGVVSLRLAADHTDEHARRLLGTLRDEGLAGDKALDATGSRCLTLEFTVVHANHVRALARRATAMLGEGSDNPRRYVLAAGPLGAGPPGVSDAARARLTVCEPAGAQPPPVDDLVNTLGRQPGLRLALNPHVAASVVEVIGRDQEQREAAAVEIHRHLADIAEVIAVGRDSAPAQPELHVEPDRQRAAALGVSSAAASSVVAAALRGLPVGHIATAERARSPVLLRWGHDVVTEVDTLTRLLIPGERGRSWVPLGSVATARVVSSARALRRIGGRPGLRLSVITSQRTRAGIEDAVSAAVAKVPLPERLVVQIRRPTPLDSARSLP